jgi:hypothetical protein
VSLRDRIVAATGPSDGGELSRRFGVLENPYPASSQTSDNPHFRQPIDDEIDTRIESFIRDKRSQVVVVVGTQGTGKTNILNFYERELKAILDSLDGYYVVRYLSDPEASFDATLRRLIQELGVDHLMRLGAALSEGNGDEIISLARGHELRIALHKLAASAGSEEVATTLYEWLLGLRLLKAHRETLGVNFRLDTVESRTAALRDIVHVSSSANLLNGIFLLLDELEKQDGVLSATAVVRYLSSMRAIIDALPNHLFMMVAVTPDALRRYSLALPAFRSRLENRVEVPPLRDAKDALELAEFYLNEARRRAQSQQHERREYELLIEPDRIQDEFAQLMDRARRRSDEGVRQREFLHALHTLAEDAIQAAKTAQ